MARRTRLLPVALRVFPKLPPYSLPRQGKLNEQNLISKFNIDFELFGGQNETE